MKVVLQISDAADNVKESCNHLLDIIAEDKNRGYVSDDANEFYELLRNLELDDEEVERVIEVTVVEEKAAKDEENIQLAEEEKKRRNQKSLEQLKKELKEGLTDIGD